MNNLHRELAAVSEAAWAEIEEEAARTIKRHLAARRVVDMVDPSGLELAAVETGHGAATIGLYVQESFTFPTLMAEAAVALTPE